MHDVISVKGNLTRFDIKHIVVLVGDLNVTLIMSSNAASKTMGKNVVFHWFNVDSRANGKHFFNVE